MCLDLANEIWINFRVPKQSCRVASIETQNRAASASLTFRRRNTETSRNETVTAYIEHVLQCSGMSCCICAQHQRDRDKESEGTAGLTSQCVPIIMSSAFHGSDTRFASCERAPPPHLLVHPRSFSTTESSSFGIASIFRMNQSNCNSSGRWFIKMR